MRHFIPQLSASEASAPCTASPGAPARRSAWGDAIDQSVQRREAQRLTALCGGLAHCPPDHVDRADRGEGLPMSLPKRCVVSAAESRGESKEQPTQLRPDALAQLTTSCKQRRAGALLARSPAGVLARGDETPVCRNSASMARTLNSNSADCVGGVVDRLARARADLPFGEFVGDRAGVGRGTWQDGPAWSPPRCHRPDRRPVPRSPGRARLVPVRP